MEVGQHFGRVVWVMSATNCWNGADIAPALINRVWASDMVNVTAFPDCTVPVSFTSIRLLATMDEAIAAVKEARSHGHLSFRVAFWPPGVFVPPLGSEG